MILKRRARYLPTLILTIGACVIAASATKAHAPAPAGGRMGYVGRSFHFDYGEMVIRVLYQSEARLEWEQIEGPQAGFKAEEQYGHVPVREGIVFFWWQEKDTSVVTQVVDFEKASVYTTWISPDKKLAGFQGKVRLLE